MFCTRCGKELPEGANVCPSCGERIEREISFADVKTFAGQKAQQAASSIQDKAKQASASVQGKYQEFKEARERAAEDKKREASLNQSQMAQNAVPVNNPVNMQQNPYANVPPNGYANYYVNTPVHIPPEYQPISMWGYFGYEILFMIPIIGFICLVIFALGGTANKNVKNFARSYFCVDIIIVVILIMIFVVLAASN